MIVIKRIEDAKYIVSANGEQLAEFNKQKMTHPDDWVDVAEDNNHKINSTQDWRFVDERFDGNL